MAMKVLRQSLAARWQGTTVYRWYAVKSTSDQRILQALGALCAALLIYIGLWQPLVDFADDQQRRAIQSQTLADWITANRQALSEGGQRGLAGAGHPVGGGAPTIAQITSSAAQYGITFSRLQPESDGSVSVALDQQPFNALAQWLSDIENEQGYVIDRASIDRSGEEGLVNGQFRFQ